MKLNCEPFTIKATSVCTDRQASNAPVKSETVGDTKILQEQRAVEKLIFLEGGFEFSKAVGRQSGDFIELHTLTERSILLIVAENFVHKLHRSLFFRKSTKG